MTARDEDRLEAAIDIGQRLADPSELSPIQARSFVRCLQNTWNVEQIWWEPTDSERLLSDAWRLLHAASLIEELKGSASDEARKIYQRAGELFEWLERSNDTTRSETPLALLAAGSYQLAGLSAMASSLLISADLQLDGERLIAAFLKGDFNQVLELASNFWSENKLELIRSVDFSRAEGDDALSWRFTVETVRALGLFSHSLRRGIWDRNERSLKKIEVLARHGSRVLPAALASLIQILFLVSKRYSAKSIYRPLLAIAGDDANSQKNAKRYARRQYDLKQGTLWAPQIRGLERLQVSSSFALCTPTGSGKTLVANISILKELLFQTSADLLEPLALYIVPSRALASEVESKLSAELQGQVIVTGLYGGNDWGMTDYWLDADKPTVLIVTVEKAEALFRNLGPLLLGRLKLLVMDEAHQVVLDAPDKASKRFARHTDRSLRLESFVSRLIAQKPDMARIALTAVAGGAAEPVAKWIASDEDAEPIGGDFRSTRQVIGMLETRRDGIPRLRLDLVNGIDIEVQGRDGESPYIKLKFGPMPQLPNATYNSIYRFNQLSILWTAMNLVHSEQRILISIAQQPEKTMAWFCDALNHSTWHDIDSFTAPDADKQSAIYAEALSACADYCGDNSFEYRLLQSGIASSHGQMPQRLRRVMNRLIDTGICPITVATATLTEGVNLPFDIIFVPELKRAFYDPVQENREVQPMSPSEFLNLSGRAGRPGASRHGEGMTFVAVPVKNSATAPGKQGIQRRQREQLLAEYRALTAELSSPSDLPEDASPLAKLLEVLFAQAQKHLDIADTQSFLDWLEQISPGDISDHAGVESEQDDALLADTLDELDGILLAASEEASILDEDVSTAEIEAHISKVWRVSFSALSADQEEWMESAFIKRGVALVSTIYPDSDERQRLYTYGLTPHIGRKFETVGEAIIEVLKAQGTYGILPPAERLDVFRKIGLLLVDNRGYGFSVRQTGSDTELLENWTGLLGWWMNIEGMEGPEPSKLRAWQRFISNNLEFRLGVAIGAAVSKAWNDGSDDPLEVPTLESWRETTGLPWIAFWARELIRWGTHEPFVAFCMSQGLSPTREKAEVDRAKFKLWMDEQDDKDAKDPEAVIDPQNFMAWKQAERTPKKATRESFHHKVEVHSDLLKSSYQVLPLIRGDKVEWIDPAGFKLAQSHEKADQLQKANTRSDYVLRLKSQDGPEVVSVFRGTESS